MEQDGINAGLCGPFTLFLSGENLSLSLSQVALVSVPNGAVRGCTRPFAGPSGDVALLPLKSQNHCDVRHETARHAARGEGFDPAPTFRADILLHVLFPRRPHMRLCSEVKEWRQSKVVRGFESHTSERVSPIRLVASKPVAGWAVRLPWMVIVVVNIVMTQQS